MGRKWILILLGGVFGLGSGLALKISVSNDRRLNDARSDSSAREAEVSAARRTAENAAFQAERAPIRPPATLRERFVELTAERAKRMSDEELGQAIEQITKQIADQDAAAEVEMVKACEQLRSVAAAFPGTSAAERANLALLAMEASPSQAARTTHNRDSDDVFEIRN